MSQTGVSGQPINGRSGQLFIPTSDLMPLHRLSEDRPLRFQASEDCQVMRVSSMLRTEASKLFWANPDAYFIAELPWLYLEEAILVTRPGMLLS
jgi:hypothetical protein